MKQYLNSLTDILNSPIRTDRTGTGTHSVFGLQHRYNLLDGFPLVTTKQMMFKSIVAELLWFLEGSCDERRLCEILHGTRDQGKSTIWTANANADYWKHKAAYDGDLGRIYSAQWRSWIKPDGSTIDQISNVIDSIKNDPYSRRHLVVAYNPGEIDNMALPPCHVLFQFYVSTDSKLSCQLYQRSADFPLGTPYNIASYSILTHLIAHVCGLRVGTLVYTVGDAHIYLNQVDGVTEQISRSTKELSNIWSNPNIDNIFDFTIDDIKILNYQCHPKIIYPFST